MERDDAGKRGEGGRQRFDAGDFCLCSRDPASPDVLEDLVKVGALSLTYGMVFGGCLRDVAKVFDTLSEDLMPEAANDLYGVLDAVIDGRILAGFENLDVQSGDDACQRNLH